MTSYVCSEFKNITNCEIYDFSNSLSGSTFLCKKCFNGFFVSNGYCVKRTVSDTNCFEYDDLADKCG